MKTGILFDLDGTLLDTLEDLKDATNHALELYGFPPRTLEQIRRVVGNGAANQIRKSLPEGTPESVVQSVLSTYKVYYNDHCQIRTAPSAGILPMLEQLRQHEPVAIVSNKPDPTVKALCRQYFGGIFALGESDACPRKSAPDMVYQGMGVIGAEKCIYVGDSEVDILTAKNAGVPCISVLWGFRDREMLQSSGGTYFCEAPQQLPALIGQIVSKEG